mgnify:CR=1 FL=1
MNIEYVGGAAGFKGIPHNTTFPWVFFIMLFTLFFIKNFVNSKYGRSCIAVRENEIAAEAMGVNTTKYKVMAFTIGAIFCWYWRWIIRSLFLYYQSIFIYFYGII